jgi:hypothetical protein
VKLDSGHVLFSVQQALMGIPAPNAIRTIWERAFSGSMLFTSGKAGGGGISRFLHCKIALNFCEAVDTDKQLSRCLRRMSARLCDIATKIFFVEGRA